MPPVDESRGGPPDRAVRFTLLDAMILIAATAAGLGLLRWAWLHFQWPDHNPVILRAVNVALEAVHAGWTFLAPWGPALLIRQWMMPDRRAKRVRRRPGIVACAALTLAFAIRGAHLLFIALKMGVDDARNRGFLMSPYAEVDQTGTQAAFAVLGAWLALILIGRWRAERTWPDRLGRALGLIWILGFLILQVATAAVSFA